MRTEFFMPMVPPRTTAQQKRVGTSKTGKRMAWDTDGLAAARQKLEGHLGHHAPEQRFEGAVRLVVKWCFPMGTRHTDGEYKASRPDTDNLQKLLKDVMTQVGFWEDDAQVASEIAEKFWAAVPGIYVCVEELT